MQCAQSSRKIDVAKGGCKNEEITFEDAEEVEEDKNRRDFTKKKHYKRIFHFKPHHISNSLKMEIALEGLDGITLQALWVRLNECDQIPFKIDDPVKRNLWENIKNLTDLEYFLLPEARRDLVLHKREGYKDERGNLYEPTFLLPDIYEYAPIEKNIVIPPSLINKSINVLANKKNINDKEIKGKDKSIEEETSKKKKKEKKIGKEVTKTKKIKKIKVKNKSKTKSKGQRKIKGKGKDKEKRNGKSKDIKIEISNKLETTPISTNTKTMTKKSIVFIEESHTQRPTGISKPGKRKRKTAIRKPKKVKFIAKVVQVPEEEESAKANPPSLGRFLNIPMTNLKVSTRVKRPRRKRKRTRIPRPKGVPILIRGSCPTYLTRENITKKVVGESFDEVESYGNRLVIVASQQARENEIFSSTNYSKGDLNIIQYCIMERVARARLEGEPTRGSVSLGVMKIEAKSLFHQRKALLKGNLIKKQMVPMKFGPTRAPCFTTVFHLPRFYKFVETGVTVGLRKVFNMLKDNGRFYEETAKMKKLFGKHMVMNLIDGQHGCLFRQYELPLSETRKELYEDENTSDKIRDQMDRKNVKVMALVKANIDIESYVRKPSDEKFEAEVEDEDDFDAVVFKVQDLSQSLQASLIPSLMCQVWLEGGTTGVSLGDISRKYSITPLEARTAGRTLTRIKFAQTVLAEKQKTKVHNYIMKDLYGLNATVKKLQQREEQETIPEEVQRPIPKNNKKSKKSKVKKIPTLIDVTGDKETTIEVEIVENSTTKFETKGWEVTIDLNPPPKEPPNYNHYKTLKTIERERYILEFIKSTKFVVGFAPILTSLKRFEARMGEVAEVDKKTVIRIIQNLHSLEKLAIWSVMVNKDKEKFDSVIYTVPEVTPQPDGVMGDIVQDLINRCTRKLLTKPVIGKPKRKHISLIMKTTPIKGPKRGLTEAETKAMLAPDDLNSSFSAAFASSENKRDQKYDSVDREVLEKLKAQRALWSGEEDNQILYLFMASVLFMPKYDFKRIFIFNAAQIRDILHLRLEESLNKTSIAVRRRIHHLLKKDRQLAAYEYFVGKALNDEFLHVNLLQRYRNEIDERKVFSRVPNEALIEVSDYLIGKFGGKDREFNWQEMDKNKTEMSRCKTGKWELRWKEEDEEPSLIVAALDDPHTDEEIKLWLARTSLLTLILCGDNVEVLQSFLQPLQDESLEEAIGAMRQLELATVEKKTLKFSISYLVKKRMLPYLAPAAYGLADTFLKATLSVEEIDLSFYYEPSVFAMLSELSISDLVDYTIIFPDSVICVNDEWRHIFETLINNEEEQEQSEDSSSGESEEDLLAILPPPQPRILPVSHSSEDLDLDEPTSKRRRVETISSKLEQIIERNFVLISNEKAVKKTPPTPSIVHISKRHLDIESEGRSEKRTVIISKGVTKNVSDISNKALRFIRERMNSDENNDKRVERDFFSIVLPKVSAKLGSGVGELFYDKNSYDRLLNSIQNILYIVIPTQCHEGEMHIPSRPKFNPKWKMLYLFIESFGSLGISMAYLKNHMERAELLTGLKALFKNKSIYIVGIVHIRIVACSYVLKWAMAVPKNPTNCKETQMVLMRPWVRCSGGINWHLIDMSLAAIIGFLTQHPVLSIRELGDFTRPLISPLETMILLTVLHVGKIVQIGSLSQDAQVFLFSELPSLQTHDDFNMMIDLEEAEVKLDDFPTIKYALLRKTFEAFLENIDDGGLKVIQKDPSTDGRRKRFN